MERKKKVSLLCVGDIMLGDLPQCYGFGVGSKIERFGPSFPFEYCIDELNQADILFGNLETVLSGFDRAKDNFESIILRAQPVAAQGLTTAGFNVLSIANNHILQHGQMAFRETLDVLSEHGIKFTGANLPERGIDNSCVINKKGFRICFLAYNFRPRQYFHYQPPYAEGDFEIISDNIAEMKSRNNIVIVSLHWGEEFIDYPSTEQIDLAHRIIDCGAHVILGHHPHILQGIEDYKGGIIAYSLGNFVFDMWQERFRKTMILKLMISEKGEIDYEIIPVIINSSFQPRIADGNDRKSILDYISRLSQKLLSQSDQQDYDIVLRRETRKYRWEVYIYYLTHFHKYNPKHLLANFVRVVKVRLK